MTDIFISYDWESKNVVQKIVDLLRSNNGYQVWMEVVNAGDVLHGVIEKCIDNCKLFVAFITKKYCESRVCQLEIKYAFEQKKKCIFVILEEYLGEDTGGIRLIIAGNLRLNAFDLINENEWPENLYKTLSNDIDTILNLERLITCRVCKKRFNLKENEKDSCRKPMQTNCNMHRINENVLCERCFENRKKTLKVGFETILCPFVRNDHLLENCIHGKRFYNIIRYFELKDSFQDLSDDFNYFENLRNITTNKIRYELNENKRKIKESVKQIIKELHNYEAELVKKLDEEWKSKQVRIEESLKLDKIIKATRIDINELQNDLEKIEIAVKRNDSDSVDEHLNENVERIKKLNETIIMLQGQIAQESKTLQGEMCLHYKNENKISELKQAVGVLEMKKIHLNQLENIVERKNERDNGKKYLKCKIEKIFVDIPEIVDLCSKEENNHDKIKEFVVNQNANVNFNVNGWTALMRVSQIGHLETVKLLIQNGANVNEKTTNGNNTALMKASQSGHFETVKWLIENGAIINQKNNYGDTALYIASEKGHLETVKLLIQYGANVNEKNNYGNTALNMASRSGHLETVKLLIENGVNVNEMTNNGWSALLYASRSGHLKIVKLLIQNGMNVNKMDENGWTALILAGFYGKTDVVNYLKSIGAK